MTTVAVLDDWQNLARECADWSPLAARAQVTFFSRAFSDEADAAANLRDYEIVLSMRERTPMPASLIGRLERLKMLGITAPKNASLDVAACTARGVLVCNTTAYPKSASAPAELALGLLVAVVRAIPAADAAIRAGRFQEDTPAGITLAGKTLGVLGLGRLGTCMARYGQALGMKVLAWSQNLTAEAAAAAGAEWVSKEELFARCDAISVHLVLSPRTRHIVGVADIARMKPGAVLINTSRGPLIDEDALLLALQQRRIFAALDVFDREPLPVGHPLRSAPNTVLTPHIGYTVIETLRQFYGQSVENAVAFLDGRPIRVLNPEVLQR
ncbi:MAG TPA: D-2-hydroxyacid dehydrogenase family protein [Steroidobacteraceae bacterium]|nr:D-2-hydroxyacid dehydrogenase family protein [Steroidobacteraceae bacterium]